MTLPIQPETKVKRFDPRVFIPVRELRRVLNYRETLRSFVLAGHGQTLAPAPEHISPNLSRTPTTRTYVPSGGRLASGGVAGQIGGRGIGRGSNVAQRRQAERGEAVGGSVLNLFEGRPGYVGGGRGGRGDRRGRGGRGERRERGRGRGVAVGGGGGGGGGGSWRRGGEGNTGRSQTSISGRGREPNQGQEARVARTVWDLTRWAKETPDILFCENPFRIPFIYIPPEFDESDCDDDHDDDWEYRIPLPYPFPELVEAENRFLAANFKPRPDTIKANIDEWLQDIP